MWVCVGVLLCGINIPKDIECESLPSESVGPLQWGQDPALGGSEWIVVW